MRFATALLLAALTGGEGATSDSFHAGLEAFVAADYTAAERSFRQCVAAKPQDTHCLEYLGFTLYRLQRHAEAVAALRQALEANRVAKLLSPSEVRAVTDEAGMAMGLSGQVAAARAWYERAVRDDPEFPNYYYNLGCAFAELGDADAAIANLRLALHHRSGLLPGESLPDPRLDSSFASLQGNEKFAALLAEAYGPSATLKDPAEAKRRIDALERNPAKGGVAGEVAKLEEIRAIAHRAQLFEEEASAAGRMAALYAASGDFLAALSHYREALELFRGHHLAGETFVLLGMGTVYRQLGNADEAARQYEQAKAAAERKNERGALVDVLNAQGVLAVEAGRYADALRLLTQALAKAEELKDLRRQAWIYNDIGGTYLESANYPLSLANSLKGVDRAQHARDKAAEAGAWNGVGNARAGGGEYEEALKAYARARALAPYALEPRFPGRLVNNIAEAYAMLGRNAEALATYREALRLKNEVGDVPGMAVTLGNIGAMYERLRDYGEAEKALQAMLELADRRHLATAQAYAWDGLGLVAEDRDDPWGALAAYERSIGYREGIRAATYGAEMKASQALLAADAYEHAVLLDWQLGKLEAAFDLAERARSRTFLERMGDSGGARQKGRAGPQLAAREAGLRAALARLDEALRQDTVGPEQRRRLVAEREVKERDYEDVTNQMKVQDTEIAAAMGARPLALAEVRRALPEGSTLVSYFVAPSVTLAFVVGPWGFHVEPLRVTAAELRRAASEFYPFASLDVTPEAVRTLYRWLIKPILPYLGAGTLLVAPHGPLHLVPFAALAEDPQHWLGERFPVVELPSASGLQWLGRQHRDARQAMAAFAYSHPRGEPPLDYADGETRAVAEQYGSAPHLDATAAEFRVQAREARIVHVAAHGEMDAVHPAFSRILLGPTAGEEGSLAVKDIYDLELPATELVVLSACDSGAAVVAAGDEAVALDRAFLVAGASSVVASLWAVRDDSTSKLMRRFYIHLRASGSAAQALRQAQADLRQELPHPYHWAGFVLTGDPGKR